MNRNPQRQNSGAWLSLAAAKRKLAKDGEASLRMWERGQIEIKLYEPKGIDAQQPHSRDELYVVIRGSGHFMCANEIKPFTAGDVLFAPAWTPHRFVDFTRNLSVWVIFYGPEGGEQL